MIKTISDNGLAALRFEEGFREHAYLDTKAKPPRWTVGYGETFLDQRPVREGDTLPQAAAAARLRMRCDSNYGPGVRAALGSFASDLSQTEYDALVSFTYNEGVGAFAGSTLCRLLISGDRERAASEFEKWVYAGGKADTVLVARRKRERDLFAHGQYPNGIGKTP